LLFVKNHDLWLLKDNLITKTIKDWSLILSVEIWKASGRGAKPLLLQREKKGKLESIFNKRCEVSSKILGGPKFVL